MSGCCTIWFSSTPAIPSYIGLIEAIMTGGIPPDITQMCSAEAVYRALYRRVMLQNQRYYERFPGDVNLMHRIVAFLSSKPGGGALLPSGSVLTPRALQLLGLNGRLMGHRFRPLHIETGSLLLERNAAEVFGGLDCSKKGCGAIQMSVVLPSLASPPFACRVGHVRRIRAITLHT